MKAVEKTSAETPSVEGPSYAEVLKLLDEHIPGVIVLDSKSTLLYANQAALKILGKEREQVSGVRVGKLKNFSLVTEQLGWEGVPCQLMLECSAERRISRLKLELRKAMQDLEELATVRSSVERTALDAEGRAQEMEGFLEQMEAQQSELESRLEELAGREQESRAEWTLIESRLLERIQEFQESELRAASREAENQRRISELEATLQESRDEVTIARYDLNESLEKLQATREKLANAEGRVKDAADELFKAWEAAEVAQSKVQNAEELREKAEKRTAELEALMEKFTPEDDDTIMGFL